MSAPPAFLQPKPKPGIEMRLYHGSSVPLWRGRVRLSDVQGWAENPRLELEMKRWKIDFGDDEISQDALYDMMKNTRHVRLEDLSTNIAANGLREPIVLTFDGKLLDGNRRFFAVRLAHERTKNVAKKQDLELIPAFVLTEDATEQAIQNILVEENFSPSLKEEWPYYVKAEHVRRAREDEKMSVRDIADKFGWTTAKVYDTLRIGEITDAFMSYAASAADSDEEGLGLSTSEAERIVADNYQFFNEAKKSFRGPLAEDADFAELFFGLVAKNDDEKFFSRWDEVRCAYEGYKHPSGKLILQKGEPGGGKDLKALIQMERSNFRAQQSAEERIQEFVEFLRKLSAEQMRTISDDARKALVESLSLVQDLVETARKQK